MGSMPGAAEDGGRMLNGCFPHKMAGKSLPHLVENSVSLFKSSYNKIKAANIKKEGTFWSPLQMLF
jgi:hypothetical protein